MQNKKYEIWPINQVLIFWLSLSVIFLIFKYTSVLLVPFLIAIAIAIILSPILTFFERKGVPKILSLLVIIIVILIPSIILGGYLGEEIKHFANNFENIKQQSNLSLKKFILFLNHFGIDVTHDEISKILKKNNFGEIIKNLITQAGNQFSNIFLIFFMVAFMLMESSSLYNKIIKITEEYTQNIEDWMNIIEKIKSYFLIKVKTSFITATWILLVLWYYDVNYLYIWATLAFFLNFIPVIGSILAAIPPIIIVLLDQTYTTALWVSVWYVIINIVIGNIVEPRIMGKGLGLSPLIIFLSMTFWGWIFGPAGMILSIPLTMVMQFFFEQYNETRWISLLFSDYKTKNL